MAILREMTEFKTYDKLQGGGYGMIVNENFNEVG